MGQIASEYSDIIIITDDDPDTENRLQIINQIQK
jgi:UDP-N-acetylmuramyl tripeptide synthase